MPLPLIERPKFSVNIPSTKKPVTFHLMTRREEKILLMAKTSKDEADWLGAIRQVVSNCSREIDVDKLTSFDLEFCFVKLRAASISNIEKLTYIDHLDANKEYEVEVNLDEVEVVFPEGSASNLIDIGDETKIQLRWPSAATWADNAILRADNQEAALDSLVASCLDKIWTGANVYDPALCSSEELQEFVDTLDIAAWDKIRAFIAATPHLSYWVSWTNSQGTERKLELKSLADFFSFA